MSSVLFHGPSARQQALNTAVEVGRLVCPPIGDGGLKVDEVREAMDILLSTPVGVGFGVVVIGPMDQAGSNKASDGLLKIIEEPPEVIQPFLWAYDLGEVSPTIRSRCLPRWCPPVPNMDDEEIEGDGRKLVESALAGRLWEIPPLVQKYSKKDKDVEDDESGAQKLCRLLQVAADGLITSWSPEAMALWERIRLVARSTNPRFIEVVAAFLPDPQEG